MIDVLVIGAGPAGLATALAAARRGLSVQLVEPRRLPIDKACGEGIMPSGVAALARWGVEPAGVPLRGIAYLRGHRLAVADFPDSVHRPGLGVRRTVLHRELLRAVEQSGVQIVTGTATDIRQNADWVMVDGVPARYVVAADGLHSPTRAAVGIATTTTRTPRRWGQRQHFQVRPWSDYVQVHWADDAEAYVTPVALDCVNVAVLSSRRASFSDHLAAFPALRERLGGDVLDQPRAAGPLRCRVSRQAIGRVLLVGDAAGYVDALTGEGLCLAFACAAAAVERLAQDRPDRYARDYARISRRYRLITSALLAATRSRTVRRAIVPTAQQVPRLFGAAVAQLASDAGYRSPASGRGDPP